MSEQIAADYVAVEVAGKATGIPARTLRHWIGTGKLSAIAGKRGKLVSLGEIARIAELVGKPVGNANTPDGNPATFAEEVAGNVAERLADTALVTDAARQQLGAIRDEWLAPLVAQLTEQAEKIGRLEQERDELRRRAEVAEAALATVEAAKVAPAAPQPRSVEEPPPAPVATPIAPAPAGGFWRRVRRALVGE